MKCIVCGSTTKLSWRKRTPSLRISNVYCPVCDTKDSYVTLKASPTIVKAMIALFYDESLKEKDERYNPYIRRFRHSAHFDKDIEPLFANKETRSIDMLLEAKGVRKGLL